MTFLRNKWFIVAACMALFAAALPGKVQAADYPTKPITLISCYAPGGDSDLSARLWAEFAERKLGQTILVVNKTGGGGVTGTAFAAAAKPDGYTLYLAQAGPVMLTPKLAKTNFNFDSFEYISRVTIGNCALIVNADAPWNNLKEFIADAKAKPGTLSFASPGATTWLSFAIRHLTSLADIKVKFVEFQGAAPAITSVLGGHTTFSFVFPQNYVSQAKSGQIKVLAIGERTDQLPNVQSFEEQGYPGSYYGWAGIAAPKGVDPAIVAKLESVTAEIAKDPEFIEKANNIGATPSFLNHADWAPVLQEQATSLAKLLEQTKFE